MLNTLGLATKAGRVISGTDMVLEGIRNGKVHLVFIASDSGFNTNKTITDKCSFYNVPVIASYTSVELSNAIGKKNRMVIGITDIGFTKLIKEKGGLSNGK